MSSLPTLTFSGIDLLTIDNSARAVVALLPDGTRQRIARNVDDDGRPVIIPPHLAYVRYELDDLDAARASEQRQPDLVFQAQGKTFGVCFLRHERVEVEGPFESDDVTFESSLVGPSPQPTSADRLTFNEYVVDFMAACPDIDPVDRRLADPTTEESQRLSGWVRMTRGHFAASYVDPTHVWTFDPNAQRQPFFQLAQEVPVAFRMRENKFSLRFSPLLPQGDPAPSALHFGKMEGARLNVRIGNAPLDAILMQAECIEENVDYHFELYYDLYPQRRDMPRIPRKRIVGKEPHASNCPLVRGQFGGGDPPGLIAGQTARGALGTGSVAMISASPSFASRNFAIHLGVGGVDPLADLAAWRNVTARYDHQVMLANRAATTGALRKAIDDAGSWLRDGGLLFVTFSGHAAIYPRLHDRMITAEELRALWANFQAGVRIVFLSDSCHSGAALPRSEVPADVLLLAACDSNGVAYEGAARDEASFFTAMMKRAIDERRGATLRSQFDRASLLLQETMRGLPVRQTPKWKVVSGDEGGFDRLVMF